MISTNSRVRCAVAALALAFVAGPARGADWGTIKGRFVYDGKSEAKTIQPTKDTEYCGKHKLTEESILVSDGALQNVFVFLYLARGKTVDVHPDYKADGQKPAVLDNHNCRFEPHAMTLWTAQPLEIRNSDPGIGHNTNAQQLVVNTPFNETVTNDKPVAKKFDKSEPLPTHVTCNIHPWMGAYMLVRDNPYMALSGKDGKFEIKNVPAGKNDFVFWHEAKGNLKGLEVGKKKAGRKGEVELVVEAGKTLDLGDIKVTSKILGQ